MTDLTTKSVLSVIATRKNKIKDLAIKDGQLVFIQDSHKIAFDFGGRRVFYNQIEEFETDEERLSLSSPTDGCYYFVIKSAVLWTYQNGWIQITTPPEEIVFIDTELPELGSAKTIYINKKEGCESISVWDNESQSFKFIAGKAKAISSSKIDELF